MKFTTTEFVPIRKVSDISEGQTVVCFLAETVIQDIIARIDP
jgi:hypothetical protein